FSPGHRDLHRIFANPTESQLAEITQFFLRQPLMHRHPLHDIPLVEDIVVTTVDAGGGSLW
ncbi:hypothetical protein, partial [Sinorhizobium meliloti]|uniref:hypothetical protein n=1 Tax=Rhizobium meliloti TaxID=382 RepID=UPI000FD394FF